MTPPTIPASVTAMADDPGAPTAPLADFIDAMAVDDNWWWRIACGHHLNLYEEALDDRYRFRGHSVLLNTVAWRIAQALGLAGPEDDERPGGNVLAEVDLLIAQRDGALRELRELKTHGQW